MIEPAYIEESLWPLVIEIDECHLDPANARTGHALDQIASSLAAYKQRKPIVVNRSEGMKIEAGNGTYQAARVLGWTHIAAVIVEDDAATAVGYAIADNRLGDLSEWDNETLAQLLTSLEPDMVTGFDAADVETLLAELGEETVIERGDAEPRIDVAAELQAEWETAVGQLWRLNSRVEGQYHLLVCGDCTDAAVVQRVMRDERAALFATDPPYLVNYDGNNRPDGHGKEWQGDHHQWDGEQQGDALYDGFVTAAIDAAIAPDAAWYCWYASRRHRFLEDCWERHGVLFHQQIIWAKSRAAFTRSWYRYQHEPAMMGWLRGNKPTRRGGDEYLTTVWNVPSENLEAHPTQKPLALFEIPMRQHTQRGDICYEPFSGSGSQILAAENLGRQCRAIELQPAYVAVALQRYEDAFGIKGCVING